MPVAHDAEQDSAFRVDAAIGAVVRADIEFADYGGAEEDCRGNGDRNTIPLSWSGCFWEKPQDVGLGAVSAG